MLLTFTNILLLWAGKKFTKFIRPAGPKWKNWILLLSTPNQVDFKPSMWVLVITHHIASQRHSQCLPAIQISPQFHLPSLHLLPTT